MSIVSKFNEDSSVKIPEHILIKAGLKTGAEIIWLYDEHGQILLMEKPDNFSKAMKGLGEEIWNESDTDKYTEEERKSWE